VGEETGKLRRWRVGGRRFASGNVVIEERNEMERQKKVDERVLESWR
jgi:hypothetical protein